jgi:hypothetical protein
VRHRLILQPWRRHLTRQAACIANKYKKRGWCLQKTRSRARLQSRLHSDYPTRSRNPPVLIEKNFVAYTQSKESCFLVVSCYHEYQRLIREKTGSVGDSSMGLPLVSFWSKGSEKAEVDHSLRGRPDEFLHCALGTL